jgi:hypothetical protein
MVEDPVSRCLYPEEIAADAADDWAYDAELLAKGALLSGMRPFGLLRKVACREGESDAAALFRVGQPLSPKVRSRLQVLLKERLQVEYETIDNCCHASSQIVHLVPFVVGLAVISVLLFP